MTKLSELLGGDDAERLLQSSINIGDVFRINMGRDTGIIPKEGDDSRNKFFIVLGFDNYGNAYGGVIINSKINRKIPYEAQILHMPISKDKYDFLTHNSFVDCSELMVVKKDKVATWKYLGHLEEEDAELIIETIKTSPFESEARLAQFGIT